MDIPKDSQRPAVRTKNPITSDPALTRLLDEGKNFRSEDEFKGWKDSFLNVYRQYLDPAGVENAHASDARLLRSMEKLAATVVSVNALVDEGKITAESQTVMGKRALTNMTDQLAKTEKEIARFMPTTGAEEQTVGYDKFELGAVMIEDGFHVYELLMSTQSVVLRLQAKVLNEVLPQNKQSIIQFYLRQIQSFCDVMADLGLFGLMEDVIEMYKVKPRSKGSHIKSKSGAITTESPRSSTGHPTMPMASQDLPEEEPQIVELDPDKIYNFRSSFTGGYIDPFSGTAPGNEEESPKDPRKGRNEVEKGNDGDEDFIIYFDMKTGCIGKIPRKACAAKSLIVSVGDSGEETLDGQIEDEDEKEQLIWDMKKAMKSKSKANGNSGLNGSPVKSPGSLKTYVVTPKTGAKRTVNRSKSGDSAKGNLRGFQAPRLDHDEDDDAANNVTASPSKSKRPSSGGVVQTPLEKSPPFNAKNMLGATSFEKSVKDAHSMSSTNYAGRKNDPVPSTDGWEKPALTKNVSDKANKRPSIQKATKHPKPSNDGWASASTMAAGRRKS